MPCPVSLQAPQSGQHTDSCTSAHRTLVPLTRPPPQLSPEGHPTLRLAPVQLLLWKGQLWESLGGFQGRDLAV